MPTNLSIKSWRIGIACALALVLISLLLLRLSTGQPSPLAIVSMTRLGTSIVCVTSNQTSVTQNFRAYGESKVNGKWERTGGSIRGYSPGPGAEEACRTHLPNTGSVWRVAFVLHRTSPLTSWEKGKMQWRLWFATHNMETIASLVGRNREREQIMHSPEYQF